MKFDLKKPCSDCPLRSDIESYLTKKRAKQIVFEVFNRDRTFTCHKYAKSLGHEGEEQHCAGMLILQEKNGSANQMMRIAERLGFYNYKKLEMDSPIFETPYDFIEAQER